MIEREIYSGFGNSVASHRKAIGLTQAEFAKRARMTRVTVANIESGQQSVLLHQAYILAAALGIVTVADLLPPLRESSLEEGPKVTLSKQTFAEQEGAQVAELVSNVLGALFPSQRSDRDR